MQNKVEKQEIDRIVDGLVKDDNLAKALKEKLHGQFSEAPSPYSRPDADVDQGDEMWDNMPV